MKKILTIILAFTMILSLSACGEKEPTKFPNEDLLDNSQSTVDTNKPEDTNKEEGTDKNETPEKEEVTIKEKLTIEKVIELSKKGESLTWDDFSQYESKDIGSGLYILLFEIDENFDLMIGGTPNSEPMYIRLTSKANSENNVDIRTSNVTEFIENTLNPPKQKNEITIPEGSALQAKTEFNGLYKINGYTRMNFMGNLTFQAGLEAVNSENAGEVDLSKAKLSDNILDYVDYFYVSLEFENDKIVDWDVVDRKTNESIMSLDDKELLNRYFPETNFEVVEAGALTETINLSNYEIGKTYAFDVSKDENFSAPQIINDTEHSILIVSIRTSKDDAFERQFKSKHAMPDTSVSSIYSNDGKYYVAIIEGNVNEFANSDDCLILEGYKIGDELDFDFEDYVLNNTDKTITLTADDWGTSYEFVLLPNEVLECSWMDDIVVKDIK